MDPNTAAFRIQRMVPDNGAFGFTDSAAGARRAGAVGRRDTLQRATVLALEEAARAAGAHVLPRQAPVQLVGQVHELIEVDAVFGSSLLPVIEREMLYPSVKARARAPSIDDDGRHVTTGAGERGLDERGLGIVVMHADGTVANARDK